MGKKKGWLERLKRFFSSETKHKQEKKEKRKNWLSGRLKTRCPPLLPDPSLRRSKSLQEAEKEQSKHAVAVAVATAAAADAAVAAARAAAQVVWLTGTPFSHSRAQDFAAIKIQCAFRGLLARRALRALKGLVKLQALIRGQAVRRQTTTTLKGLQSLMKIQTETCATRMRAAEDYRSDEDNNMIYVKVKESTLQQNINRRWDSSVLSKQEIIALLNNRREAASKRERAMEYAFSHKERIRPTTPVSKEFEQNFGDRRWSWLDQWVGAQPLENKTTGIFATPCRDQCTHEEKVEENRLRYLARRSFDQSRRTSLKDDDSFSSSPSFPRYMASTASAKARFRSLSTPKQRLKALESCSEYCAPNTGRLLSPFPSNASYAGPSKNEKLLKSPRVALRSDRSLKYSFDSECSLLNWDQHNAFR